MLHYVNYATFLQKTTNTWNTVMTERYAYSVKSETIILIHW